MALTQRLDLRQSQSLVMTPQLQQAIKLLQLSNLDLAAFVDREIEENPLLEAPATGPDDFDGADGALGPGIDGAGLDAAGSGPELSASATRADSSDLVAAGTWESPGEPPLDADFSSVWSEDDWRPGESSYEPGEGWASVGRGGSSAFDDEGPDWENRLAADGSLRSHLEQQFNLDLARPDERLIASMLMDGLDGAGYLTLDLDEVAGSLGCARTQVDQVLGRLQQLDPPGIFARSLKECLALQLRDRNRLDPAMAALLDNLHLIAQHDYAGMMAVTGLDGDDITEMLAEIRRLDPKPAARFDSLVPQIVVPDVLMRPQAQGGWVVELNPETLPRVLINRRYYTTVSRACTTKADREYLAERMNSANWLVKSLDQRANTILKVAAEIVRQQDAFFAHGVGHLRPLILRDIAEAIGMHESTVSRVTSNKYIATPRSVIELKYFFSTAIAAADGGAAHSAEAVRHRIRSMIDQELPDAVLSDDRIVEILQGDGIDIARRTVAKYRELLGIPSSVQRRRQKSRPARRQG